MLGAHVRRQLFECGRKGQSDRVLVGQTNGQVGLHEPPMTPLELQHAGEAKVDRLAPPKRKEAGAR